MKWKKVVYWVLAFVCFVYLALWDFFTKPAYTYCNASKTFRFTEEAGADLLDCERAYGYFLCGHPEVDKGDNRLFRMFAVEPWKFWQWRQLLLHGDRFGLPYMCD